jgi:predicted porin
VRKIIVGFIATNCVVFLCSGKVLREDVVSYSLDYYEIKEKERSVEQEEAQIITQREEEKRQIKNEAWENKKKKIDEFLRNVLLTIQFKTTYNDNIYNEKEAESDIINVASINANYISKKPEGKQGKTDFFLDFRGDGIGYTTSKDPSSTGTTIRGGMNYNFTKKYSVLLDAGYTKRQQLASETLSDGASSDKKIIDNNILVFGGEFTASWGRFPWSLSYRRTESKFEEEYKNSDSTEDVFKITPAFKVSPKTEIFCEYNRGKITYPERQDRDYDYSKYLVGARGKVTSKITGIVKFGWGAYDYESGNNADTEEIDTSLSYRLSKRFLLSAIAGTSIKASTYADNDSSKNKYIGLSGRYFPPFNKKLTLKGSMKFTNVSLSDTDREDDMLALRLGAEYGFNKNLALSLEYEHAKRESTDSSSGYVSNITSLTGVWEF